MDLKQNPIPSATNLMNSFNAPSTSLFTPKLAVFLVVAVVLGIGSGYVLSGQSHTESVKKIGPISLSSESGKIVGSNDTKTFKDTAEGILKVGGIEGEGTYHLVRSGGKSQNVYLTSSIVDLSVFVDKKIKVWGQTQKAQKAGWLMDVGRVEVLEL